MINTARVTDRRELHFDSLAEIMADVEYLDSGDPPRTIGNWTPAQGVQHVTKIMNYSMDGFPVSKVGLSMRVLGRLMRKSALTKPLRAGYMFPRNFKFLAPDPHLSWEEAVDDLRAAIQRCGSKRMAMPSPILGSLTHEQWEQFHCRHAELHFSFIRPADE